MKYIFALHKDKNLSHNIKYREQVFGAGQGQVWSGEVVSIGNFASKDLFGDNSVEISCPYELALTANFVRLKFEDWHTIGPIIHWEYINDQNTRIHYVVDAYSSAVASGRLENLSGLCDRVNSYCLEHWINLLPEPFAPSDIQRANPDLTIQFTDFLDSVEGFEGGTTWLQDDKVNFVLTVSPAIVDFLNVAAFDTPPFFSPEFKNRSTLNFKGADFTQHYGGIFRGTPLLFTSIDNVRDFIKQILSGCGFVTKTGPEGFTGQEMKTRLAVSYIDSPGGATVSVGNSDFNQQYDETMTESWNTTETGGYAWNGTTWINNSARNTSGTTTTTYKRGQAPRGLEYCRPITSADIYNLYCLPKRFCNDDPHPTYFGTTITGFRNYLNMSDVAAELPDKAKLAAYPYCYNKIVTANGDIVDIIPQSHYQNSLTSLDPNYTVKVRAQFIGGDAPRVMGMIESAKAGSDVRAKVESWFTIRNYPAITSALNDDWNIQQQKDFTNLKQIGASAANARIQSRLNNPLIQGFTDGVGTSAPGGGTAGNLLNQAGAAISGAFNNVGPAGISRIGRPNNYGVKNSTPIDTKGFFVDPSASAAAMTANSLQGQIISPSGSTIMGNDFLGQFQVLPVSVYDCGASDSELFSFARYLGKFGSAVSGPLNPRTNVGLLFGGRCLPQPFEGRTFYQFLSMEVEETIPRQWKDSIESLFKSGVWLIEN